VRPASFAQPAMHCVFIAFPVPERNSGCVLVFEGSKVLMKWDLIADTTVDGTPPRQNAARRDGHNVHSRRHFGRDSSAMQTKNPSAARAKHCPVCSTVQISPPAH